MSGKSLLHSARITVGNKIYIAGKKRKTFKVSKNIGFIKTAGTVKRSKTALLRKTKNQNPLFWRNKPISAPDGNSRPNNNLSALSGIKNSLKNYSDGQDDNAAASIATAIKAGEVSAAAFKAASAVSPYAFSIIKKTGKGVYNISGQTIKIIGTVDRTAGKVIAGEIKLDINTLKDFRNLSLDKIRQTRLIKTAVSKIEGIRQIAARIKKNIVTAKRYTVNTYKFIGAVLNGNVTVRFTAAQLKKVSVIAAKSAVNTAAKATKPVLKTAKKTIKGVGKASSGAIDFAANSLSQSEDTGVQAISHGIKTARYAPKAIRTSGKVVRTGAKGIKTAVNAPIKTARAISNAINSVRANGLRNSARNAGAKLAKVIAKSGKSVVSALVSILKKAALKLLAPVALIAVVVAVAIGAFAAPLSVVLDMFGGIITFFFGDGSDSDKKVKVVEEYIEEETERVLYEFETKIKNTMENNLTANGGDFHIVKLFLNTDGSEEQISSDEIVSKLSSGDETGKIIEPFYNILVFSRYERKVSEDDSRELVNEILGEFFTVSAESMPTEYCSESSDCGSRHASLTCPNYTSGKHNSYTCSLCDHYTFSYDAEKKINFMTGFVCNGYRHCLRHKVLGVTIELKGIDKLTEKYFTTPIAELEAVKSKTEKQKDELETLKSNYNLLLSYIDLANE